MIFIIINTFLSIITAILSTIIIAHTFIHASMRRNFPAHSRVLQIRRTKYGERRKILEREEESEDYKTTSPRRGTRKRTYIRRGGEGVSFRLGDSVILNCKVFFSQRGTEKERSFRLKFLFCKVARNKERV